MDHRCLYGHRVPADFTFAIEHDACPRCGAPLISIAGYQLARGLASSVPLEAVQAFATVRYLEQHYELTPREPEPEPEQQEAPVEEAEETPPALAEAEEPAPAPARAVAPPRLVTAAELGSEPDVTEEVELEDVSVDEVSPSAPSPTGAGPVAPIVLSEIPARDEDTMDDVEKAFFQ